MSYILEALRKSERERALGRVPSLDTVHERARPASPLPWVIAMIAVLVLSAAVAAWLLRDSAPGVTETSPGSPSASVTPAPTPPAAAPPAPPVGDARVAAGTLPPSLREQLPALAVNVVSYSDEPAKRFIMINQRILREGEQLGPDIMVREIMSDGARLEFRGHEFLVRP